MVSFPMNAEIRFYNYLEKHALILGAVVIAILGIGLHISGWYLKSRDYIIFLDGWYNQIAAGGGLFCLSNQVGNYNIPYQVVIAIMTYLPISARSAYKLVSCLFDVVLAVAAGTLVWLVRGRRDRNLAAFMGAVVFSLPTVAMNSGWWAQCDSIWTSFCLLSLVAFIDRRNTPCFLLYGCALAFKLQAIFLLPFYIFALVRTKRFSVSHFLLIPVSMVVLSLPGLLFGRNIVDIVTIYMEQASGKAAMYLNYPSFWAMFVGADAGYSDYLKTFAILLTVVALVVEAIWLIVCRVDLEAPSNVVVVAALFVFTAVFFLPAMHERYAYLVEILLIVTVFVDRRFLLPAALAQIVTIRTYISYLLQEMITGLDPSIGVMWPLSVVNAIAFTSVAFLVFTRVTGFGTKTHFD